jgi:hypothetical protein
VFEIPPRSTTNELNPSFVATWREYVSAPSSPCHVNVGERPTPLAPSLGDVNETFPVEV